MECRDRDARLLLLATGNAGVHEAITAQVHLWRCARCRDKHAAYRAAATALSTGTGRDIAFGWHRLIAVRWTHTGFLPRLLVLILFGMAVLVTATVTTTTMRHAVATSAISLVPSGTHSGTVPRCAPDLPNDRCR